MRRLTEKTMLAASTFHLVQWGCLPQDVSPKDCLTWTKKNAHAPSDPRSARSKNSSAKAPSCGWDRRKPSCRWPPFRPAPSRSITRWGRRISARPHLRNFRAGIVRQNHHRAASDRRSAESGRHGGVHRCGARARSGLRPQAGRGCGQPAGLAARLRRAGARNHQRADRLRLDRRAGGGFGGGAGAQSRAGRRNGRQPHGRAGAADVAGHAQAHRHRFEIEYLPDLHQPDPRKDRRDVRQSGNHHGRPRAEILFVACAPTSAASPPSRKAKW